MFYYRIVKPDPYWSILQCVKVNLLLHEVGPRRKDGKREREREKEGRDERKKEREKGTIH